MDRIRVVVDGRPVVARSGSSIASVLLNEGLFAFRESERGEPRAPLCGMGVCHECRVEVDGVSHVRACMMTIHDGMTIVTAGGRR